MNKKTSSGAIAEKLFEMWASGNWVMERTQPETKVVYIGNKPTVIHLKSKGQPDYTGYEMCQVGVQKIPIFRAVEVKEAIGNSMPCCRLGSMKDTRSQNYWMSRHEPSLCCFVFVLWSDNTYELFKWKEKGSYKKGCGFK